jgi:phosphatidylserine decarboxylase
MQNPAYHPSARTQVRVRDRASGDIHTESVLAEGLMRWFYETRLGWLCGAPVFGLKWASAAAGWWQRRGWTRSRIRPFAARFGIDLSELAAPVDSFPSFDAFFTRRLQAEARPFQSQPQTLCAPADGKILVFPDLSSGTDFPVKGARMTAAALLADSARGASFAGGAALVVRLAPPDYHRFHFFDDGTAAPTRGIRGRFHSVNPIALCRLPDLLSLNQRAVTEVDTEHFGRVTQVEIGAFAVASIVQTHHPGPVRRGQEKGFFQFGGSSLVLLFQPGKVSFDADLIRDSSLGLEVQVAAGERVGSAVSA